MKLKKFKNELKNENLNIPDVYDKVKGVAYTRNITPKTRFKKLKTLNFKRVSFAFLSVFLLVFIISLGMKNSTKNYKEVFYNDTSSMRKIINQKDLNYTVRNSNKNKVNIFQTIEGLFDFGLKKERVDSAIPENSAPDDADSSKTNVQVKDVDEADIIKVEGRYIYSLSDNLLTVAETNKGDINVIDQTDFTQSESDKQNLGNSEMYVTDKYIVVLYEMNRYHIYDYYANTKEDQREKVNVVIYDKMYLINNKEFGTPIKNYEIEGLRNTSRLINNNLFILSNYQIYNYYSGSNDDISLPKINGNTINPNEVSYIKDTKVNAFSMLTTIQLDNEIKFDSNVQLGTAYWSVIYSTTNSLYLVQNNFLMDVDTEYTTILKYDYDHLNGKVNFSSACNIRGYVLNQFSLDEYNGYLRVAVTDRYNFEVVNKILVFEEKIVDNKKTLSEVGRLDKGIGKVGETIKSVRFNKDEVLVVTFRNIDPLYKIGLSDPKKPILLSEGREEPGYNSYLHYLNNELAFGIGYTEGLGGFKFSLYDIVDDLPKKIEEFKYDDQIRYYHLEAANNHKAVFVDKVGEDYIVGFSLQVSNTESIFKVYYIDSNAKTIKPIMVADFKDDVVKRMFRIKEDNNYYYVIGLNSITSYDSTFKKINSITYKN